jgi:hypothetical protein
LGIGWWGQRGGSNGLFLSVTHLPCLVHAVPSGDLETQYSHEVPCGGVKGNHRMGPFDAVSARGRVAGHSWYFCGGLLQVRVRCALRHRGGCASASEDGQLSLSI